MTTMTLSRIICPLLLFICTTCVTKSRASSSNSQSCKSSPPLSDTERDAAADLFLKNMVHSGYRIQEGFTRMVEPTDCLNEVTRSGAPRCFASAGSFHYIQFVIPQTEGFVDDMAITTTFDNKTFYPENKFRDDEAVVIVARTPPPVPYFGIAHYLGTRRTGVDEGDRATLWASLGDAINQQTVNTTCWDNYNSAFNNDAVFIATADQGIYNKITHTLVASGISENAMNLQVFSKDVLRLGLDRHSDTVHFLGRTMGGYSEAILNYWDTLPFRVFRVTPIANDDGQKANDNKFATPIRASRMFDSPELDTSELGDKLEQLEMNIKSQNKGVFEQTKTRPQFVLDGQECIDQLQNCDNSHSDATYFTNVPARSIRNNGAYYIVYGVNHASTNMARYSNAVVYSLGGGEGGTNVAIHRFDSEISFSSSADSYFPENDEDSMYFYVATVRKSCPAFEMNCFEVPEMYLASPLFFAFRSYLHPDANVGVDSSNILPSRVLFVSPDEPYIAPTLAPTDNHSSDSSKSKTNNEKKSRTMLDIFSGVVGTIFLSGAIVGGVIMHKKRKQAIKMLISGTDGIDRVPLLFDDGSSNLVTDEENNKQGSWFT